VRMRRMGRPGLVGTMARTAVVAGTATATVGAMQRHSANKADQQAMEADYAAQQQQAQIDAAVQQQMAQQQAAAAAAAAPVAAPAAEDPMAQIQKLADMKTQGLLTDEEFAAAKAKILGL
jgi:Short C-terminal domain